MWTFFGLTKSTVRAELLYRLYKAPERARYVAELERLVDAPAGNVRRELLRLTGAGLLLRRGEGSAVRYELNPDYPLLEDTRVIVEKVLGVEYAVREALEAVNDVALACAVRRPPRRGREQIEVTVVGAPDSRALMAALRPVEERLGTRLTCTVYSPDEYRRQKQMAPEAPPGAADAGSLLNGPRSGKRSAPPNA